MYVYIIEAVLYALLTAGFFAFKRSPKKEKKTVIKTAITAAAMLFIHLASDFLLYIARFIFYDINAINVGLYLFINFLGLFIPFVSVYFIAKSAGVKARLNILILIALFVVIVSGLFSYVAVLTYQNIDNAYIIAEVAKEEIDLSSDEKEAAVLEVVSSLINLIPAIVYSAVLFIENKKKRR
ncbi:MAG: hypothetical protein K5776_12835 [Lachnospiraceae bacterium]|nr:hypothetical protein [Lachnospiraceae bacterium]